MWRQRGTSIKLGERLRINEVSFQADDSRIRPDHFMEEARRCGSLTDEQSLK